MSEIEDTETGRDDRIAPQAMPVGEGEYVVQRGDCMSSIAEAHGHFWEKLWNHPLNHELKDARRDPNVLLTGDRVAIPPLSPRVEECATGKRHRFRRRGVPEKIRFHILDEDGPRANTEYEFHVGNVVRSGVTDADGRLEEWVPAQATRARLVLPDRVYVLAIGHLEPVDTQAGAWARLVNLGYLRSDDAETPRAFRNMLRDFQMINGLEPTGDLDETTQQRLREAHGS